MLLFCSFWQSVEGPPVLKRCPPLAIRRSLFVVEAISSLVLRHLPLATKEAMKLVKENLEWLKWEQIRIRKYKSKSNANLQIHL